MVYRDLSIFSGTAHPELAQAVCRYLGVPLGKAEVVKFSNENIFPKINQNVREHDVFVIQPTYPNVSDSILELLIMIDALKRASASRITAVVPYFSYARSDKKDQPRVPITARLDRRHAPDGRRQSRADDRPARRPGAGLLQHSRSTS